VPGSAGSLPEDSVKQRARPPARGCTKHNAIRRRQRMRSAHPQVRPRASREMPSRTVGAAADGVNEKKRTGGKLVREATKTPLSGSYPISFQQSAACGHGPWSDAAPGRRAGRPGSRVRLPAATCCWLRSSRPASSRARRWAVGLYTALSSACRLLQSQRRPAQIGSLGPPPAAPGTE
jgi:hypothetical protein